MLRRTRISIRVPLEATGEKDAWHSAPAYAAPVAGKSGELVGSSRIGRFGRLDVRLGQPCFQVGQVGVQPTQRGMVFCGELLGGATSGFGYLPPPEPR